MTVYFHEGVQHSLVLLPGWVCIVLQDQPGLCHPDRIGQAKRQHAWKRRGTGREEGVPTAAGHLQKPSNQHSTAKTTSAYLVYSTTQGLVLGLFFFSLPLFLSRLSKCAFRKKRKVKSNVLEISGGFQGLLLWCNADRRLESS